MTPTDQIETRLRALAASATLTPEDDHAIAEVHLLPRPRSRPRPGHVAIRVTAAAAAAVVAILLVNIAAAYFAPKYERAVADSPGIGPVSQRLLSAVGLRGSDVMVVGDSATAAGHTLKLVGAYADGLRTVLFVSIDGKGVTGNPKQYGRNPGEWGMSYDNLSLTDQFRNSYDPAGIGGPTDLQFQPLRWPASDVGARLTLHVTGVQALWKIAALGPNKVIDTETLTTHGDWTLHATLISEAAHVIALPAPVHTSVADYKFTSISASETEMDLHWTIDGPINDQMRTAPTPANPPTDAYQQTVRDYFSPHVYDAAGNELQFEEYGTTVPKTGPAFGEMRVFIKGAGRYRIQLGSAVESRWVVVP